MDSTRGRGRGRGRGRDGGRLRESTTVDAATYGSRGRRLGKGAYGEVFEYTRSDVSSGGTGTGRASASTTVDGRGTEGGGAASFAVKELDKRRLASVFVGSDRKRTLLDQARAESELQSLCACENVVEAYVWVNDASSTQVQLVMEHCERGSIVDDEAETFEPLDSEKIKIILRSILRALRTCHKRDVVHYDIKPQNVFETSDGTYKLGDFGCACEVERDKKTGERELVSKTPGTPAFTAPECCEGEPADGFKADVWAAGMTAHALATGKYFYRADSAWETYQKILAHRVDFTEIDKRGDDGFSDLLRQLLEPDPAKRLSARRALLHPWFPQEPAREMSSTPRPALRWYQRPFRWLRMKFAKRKKGKDGAAAERK